MTAFESEAALAGFIRQQLDSAPLGILVRQLQGRLQIGVGSPEGVLTAPVGVLYLRTNGGAATTLYVKESGTGNTGWVAK
jgi:hypothetical protein